MITWFSNLGPRVRVGALMVLDVFISVLTLGFAFLFYYSLSDFLGFLRADWWMLPVFLVIRLVSFHLSGLYVFLWRYASIRELASIVRAVSFSSLGIVLSLFLMKEVEFPVRILVLDWVFNVVGIGGLRVGLRVFRDYLYQLAHRGHDGNEKRVVIVGAGDAGEVIAREILRRRRLDCRLLGFLDDNPALLGRVIHQLPVLGATEDLPELTQTHRIDEVIIAIPSATGAQIRRILKLCESCGVSSQTTPGLFEIIGGQVSVSQLREVQIEDLLGREVVSVDMGAISNFVSGRTVLVTGAGGSIGSELCRQIMAFGPSELVMVDHSENSVYESERRLHAGETHGVRLKSIVSDVKDKARMDQIFSRYRPELVFHAAAYKQVPLMEDNVRDVVLNNVMGTRNIIELSDFHGVKQFVLISTDKAVNTTNCMGASKRLGEVLMQVISRNSETRFTAVRFGNVLGSVGSVIPLFKQQIAAGGPITVTHPEVTRFFMTISEAVRLVIQASVLCEGGEIFVLDMGKPVKIMNLAKDLIRLSGMGDSDIEIRVTGMRPGEKLHEELFFGKEGYTQTQHKKIFIAKPYTYDSKVVQLGIQRLIQSAYEGESEVDIRLGLMDLVVATQPELV